jgi:hypothetical protein
MTSATSDAAQVTVTQVDRKADGTVTYHFSVKVGQTETMEPGNGDALPADFFTIYNFYGLVDGSVNTPDGWKFTSEESGRTPAMGGLGPIQGASGSPGSATMVSKQAQIGMITTPSFLADLKK